MLADSLAHLVGDAGADLVSDALAQGLADSLAHLVSDALAQGLADSLADLVADGVAEVSATLIAIGLTHDSSSEAPSRNQKEVARALRVGAPRRAMRRPLGREALFWRFWPFRRGVAGISVTGRACAPLERAMLEVQEAELGPSGAPRGGSEPGAGTVTARGSTLPSDRAPASLRIAPARGPLEPPFLVRLRRRAAAPRRRQVAARADGWRPSRTDEGSRLSAVGDGRDRAGRAGALGRFQASQNVRAGRPAVRVGRQELAA